ncbi:flagellar hook protein FlgE [Paenalcaligenes suwonensis]|uniref:flagellar hook protein FlgE n=1 Tax=Paenalcaligenes suwonensis TaxID=1202713 RepID=UPI001409589B|nr:flagellar hook protein FlgE [Paenalcaligenes suwonensis]NHC61847.1 flagellar hook protein FlgE [Paenalcaligenes suwonensis]
MGFGQGLSGLNAASQNLDVIGNNIANSSTVGYKSSNIQFADVYASSRVGLGVSVAGVNQRFTIGTVSITGNQFDMAIDGEKGLFRLQDQSGAIVYSRNGQFAPDKNLFLTNSQGHRLTGYLPGSTDPQPIRIPTGNIAPKATSNMSLRANLDSNAKVVPATTTTVDPANPDTYTSSFPYNVYDSLGNAHQVTQYFIKRDAVNGESTWEVQYFMNGKQLMDESDPANHKPMSETLTFNKAGELVSPTTAVSLTLPVDGGNSPAENLTVSLSYAGSTQLGGPFAATPDQDGYKMGEYASMSIAADGSIVANYTNGQTQTMGTLVLADFYNMQGLQPLGGNVWAETATSGQPILGRPGENGMAVVRGQSVEESNVDMGQELVNMIIAQRTYQANAQTIKTQDQVLQTLITMR